MHKQAITYLFFSFFSPQMAAYTYAILYFVFVIKYSLETIHANVHRELPQSFLYLHGVLLYGCTIIYSDT